jgi:short-subunit dehydrogenase
MLCRLIGADMERQGYGKILNISSSAALFPDPWFNVYGPSKSFVLALTEAMRGELAGSGVTVTALCPGPIRTGWAENAGKAYPVIAADPRKIARIGYRAMQRGALKVLPTFSTKAGIFFLSLLPDPLKVAVGSCWQRAMIRKEKKNAPAQGNER